MPKSILIADDDAAMLNVYARLFAGTDYLISKTSCFAEAARLINSHNYDLLITDLMVCPENCVILAGESPVWESVGAPNSNPRM